MPTIASFYGITIMMHLRNKEHNPPHIHVIYSGKEAIFDLKTGNILDNCRLPKSVIKEIKSFISKYSNELNDMWNTGNYYVLPKNN